MPRLPQVRIRSEKGRIIQRFVSVKDIREQAGRIRHLESRIDAHEEARRGDQRFERAELNAFDHARNLSDLAGWEDTDLDPHIFIAADPFLDFLRDRVLRIVDRAVADLHFHLGCRSPGVSRQDEGS